MRSRRLCLLLACWAISALARDYDVEHYRIELTLDDKAQSFAGTTRVTLLPLRDGFDVCELDAETFRVTAVKDPAGRPLRFTHQGGKLKVQLGRAVGYRERVSFTVAYESGGANADPTKFGMTPGYDLGLVFKAESAGHPALVNSLSFPEGARHWFPSNDEPGDKATADILATVRRDWKVIANGRLVGVTGTGGTRTFHWAQEKPHSTYLFALVAGPYVRVADPGPGLPVAYWVYPKDAGDAARSFGKTREIIRFFESEYGVPFPWVKYDQITIPRFGGGAESTSATVIGEGAIHDAKADKDYSSHWLVAHEAAHQWWGDLVTARTWSHTWINESFATYGEYRWALHSLGEDEGSLNLMLKRNRYLAEAKTKYRRPIMQERWETPNQNFDRHTYEKGSAVLHLLRWTMGDRDFQRTTTHFLKKHSFQPADTHDFLIAAREATGQVLDGFFAQWIYGAGHPEFLVSWEWDEATRTLRLKVRQKQAPLFETPVDIGITTAGGKRIERVKIGKEEETVISVPCDARPLMVRFDEGNHLLMELEFPKNVAELRYQLEHDDAMGRMWAAGQLKAKGAEDALRRSARSDGFWAVRREAVQSAEGDGAFFQEIAAGDARSDVRAAAVRRLGALRDAGGFLAERFRTEDSYLVQAEILRALGASGDKAHAGLLGQAKAMRSPNGVLQGAAVAGLKALGVE